MVYFFFYFIAGTVVGSQRLSARNADHKSSVDMSSSPVPSPSDGTELSSIANGECKCF